MRGIIDYSGEKSFFSFITHAGNGGIVVAITEPGTKVSDALLSLTKMNSRSLHSRLLTVSKRVVASLGKSVWLL